MNGAGEQVISGGTVAAGGLAAAVAAAWSIANQVAQLIFGIPVGVLLACGSGAFFARTFLAPAPFLQTARAWVGWTLAGAYTLPLAMHVAGAPTSISASIGFVWAAALQLLAPVLVPMLIRNSPEWIRGWLDRLAGTKGGTS